MARRPEATRRSGKGGAIGLRARPGASAGSMGPQGIARAMSFRGATRRISGVSPIVSTTPRHCASSPALPSVRTQAVGGCLGAFTACARLLSRWRPGSRHGSRELACEVLGERDDTALFRIRQVPGAPGTRRQSRELAIAGQDLAPAAHDERFAFQVIVVGATAEAPAASAAADIRIERNAGDPDQKARPQPAEPTGELLT